MCLQHWAPLRIRSCLNGKLQLGRSAYIDCTLYRIFTIQELCTTCRSRTFCLCNLTPCMSAMHDTPLTCTRHRCCLRMPVDQVLKQLTAFACLHTLSISAGAMLEARHQSYGGLSALTCLTRVTLSGARSFGDYGALAHAHEEVQIIYQLNDI